MILDSYISAVKALLKEAAESNGLVSFSDLHKLFLPGTPASNVYDTLEAACGELAPFSEAIYSVLLAKKQSGLPGDGFFDMFRIHRDSEFKKIAGDSSIPSLTEDLRRQMTKAERSRVYVHAATH